MIRKLALALALWLAPLPALAALAIDSQESANTGHNSTASPSTWSFTNTAGTLLIVGVCLNNTAAGTPAVTAVSYNGVAMSAIAGTTNTGVSGAATNVCTLYQLLSPATGAHTVSVTWSGNCGGCFADALGGAISFTGNNATTPTGNPATASDTSGASTSASVSVAGTTSGDYVVSLVATGSGVGTGAGSTAVSWKLNASTLDSGDNAALGQQTTAGGTAAAGFNVTADLWFMSAVEVFAGGGAPPPTPPSALELVSVGGTLNHGDGSPGGGGALAPGFFVSNTGNDNNAGTLAAPWLTIFHAQQVMRGNNCNGVPTGLCLTYVRGGSGGSYNVAATITFTAADSGETVQYYPPDGVNSAVLDGGITGFGQGCGVVCNGVIFINAGSNITINGLKVQNFGDYGIAIQAQPGQDANGNTVENCEIANGFSNPGTSTAGGIIFMLPFSAGGVGSARVQNTHVLHNYIHDMGRNGVASYGTPLVDSYQGDVIDSNVILRTVLNEMDQGAIYLWSSNSITTPNGITVTNNFIRDYGAVGANNPNTGAHAVYYDNGMNGGTVTGNILGPPTVGWLNAGNLNNTTNILFNSDDLADQKGGGNTAKNNIIDLGLEALNGAYLGGGITAGQTKLQNNIVLFGFAGSLQSSESGHVGFVWADDSNTVVSNNLYHNYVGGQEPTNGTSVSDSSPVHADPLCSGYLYTLAGGSPAFNPPVSFPPIVGVWGPPGFVIPTSTNHSCP